MTSLYDSRDSIAKSDMEVKGFVFYKSFLTAITMLPEDCQLQMFKAICDYGLEHIEPQFTGNHAQFLVALWVSIQPQLDANYDRFLNGCKGGAPLGNQNARKQPKTTQNNPKTTKTTETTENNQKQPKDKVKEKEKEKEKAKENDSFYSSSFPPLSETPKKEEQQKKDFLLQIQETFFFRNYQTPSKEVQDFLSYNNLGDRTWETMTAAQRNAALQRWTQKPPQKPRFTDEQLAMWKEVLGNIRRSKAPEDIIADAIADSLNFLHKGETLKICCSDALMHYLEANLNIVASPIRKYMAAHGLKELHYNITK